ncbi:enhancer of split mgamma protein [Lingula anatina]|uniref:Enhancer of split mgamma protein n=1 Tax=Lingula anatina TaxID=7574 RepID=A0A1S3I0Q0_LINAN|nr:enhancer of split mgamma protein [Lingula anatina]|eukprot:XP_013390924.1 enhancer of split mgamma protein [Lingula anatina]
MGCTREMSAEEDIGKDRSRRKCAKSLAEKRRRGRINSCLVQLKRLLLASQEGADDKASKMDQADVLEMTVKYLRRLRRDETQGSGDEEHTPSKASDNYIQGYMDCTDAITTCLKREGNLDKFINFRMLDEVRSYSRSHNSLTKDDTIQADSAFIPSTRSLHYEYEGSRDENLSSASHKTSPMSPFVQKLDNLTGEELPNSPTTKKLTYLPLFVFVNTELKGSPNVADGKIITKGQPFEFMPSPTADRESTENYSDENASVWRPW